jgi:pimeloyl-ACP methyl ester carboxylesterase
MQQKVHFPSGELTLAGILHVPEGLAPDERRPAIIVLHGFGGNKEGTSHVAECELYESLGYVALRFDMRGCGESGCTQGCSASQVTALEVSCTCSSHSTRPLVPPLSPQPRMSKRRAT